MNGLILRHIFFRGRVSLTYVAQPSLTENVLKLAHGTFMAGHQVIRKTTYRLAAAYICLTLW